MTQERSGTVLPTGARVRVKDNWYSFDAETFENSSQDGTLKAVDKTHKEVTIDVWDIDAVQIGTLILHVIIRGYSILFNKAENAEEQALAVSEETGL